MRQIKYWIMQLSIRKKLVFYSYLIITPILLVISAFMFWNNYNRALLEEQQNGLQSVQGLSDNIETMQKNVMEMGTYITINEEINKILSTDNAEELNMDSQLWLHHAPMQIIQNMIAINGQIKTIAIYPENGVVPYLRSMDFSSYIPSIQTVRLNEIYNEAVSTRGKMLWQRIGKRQSDTYVSNREEKIVMYREIYDLSRQTKLGYLVIGSSAEKFDEVCNNALRENEEIVVISQNNQELVRCGALDDKLVTDIMNAQIEEPVQSEDAAVTYNYKNHVLYQFINEDTGTRVYKIAPNIGIESLFWSTIATPAFLLMGVLLGLYPIMVLVSNIVSKPLKRLSVAMQQFKKGDFNQKVEVVTLDEVGEASACFNEMVEDMKVLIDKNYVMALKEKESELDTLQAQINPHFLYNILDTLYWRTMEAGDEEIAEDILALSDLFRLVLSRGEGIVTVRNEVELLERYLQIQKMRFGKRMEYKLRVEEEIMDNRIPKLILQPFVENAIVHGFERGDNRFSLIVKGEEEQGYMVFYIRDTGVGMTPQQVATIWDREESDRISGQKIGRYAIRNVKERLELKYGSNYRLEIESTEGVGTTVIVGIPCENKGE